MITELQYFTNPTTGEIKPHTPADTLSFTELISRVHRLLDEARGQGVYQDEIDPDTGSQISGSHAGSGDGGFRAPDSTTGATGSQHRKARAVDVFDEGNQLDAWLNSFEDGKGGNSMLSRCGLFREHPSATNSWLHLQSVPPGSGRRTFMP